MRLIGYTRVSGLSQEDNTSLGDQKKRILSYADALGHEVAQVFVEVGSGSKMQTRPEFQNAIAMLRSGEADGLIALKLDRVGRNTREILELVEDVIQPLDKALILVADNIDTSTPSGRLCLTMLAALAQMEREVINERTQRGRKVKHEAGGYSYGAPRLGQRAIGGELVDDAVEQATIELIRKHRRSGKSPQSIADYLNAEGIATKRGGNWHHSTVRKILARL